jgi:hypothetical protein
MCPSISRNEGHELAAENDNAKITASPVSKVAKNAMLDVTESMTSWRGNGTAQAMASRPATQAANPSRRTLYRSKTRRVLSDLQVPGVVHAAL